MEKRINSLSGGGSARKRKTRPPFFIALHQSEEFSSSRKNAILIHCVEGAVSIDRTRLGGDCVFDLFSFLHPGQ